MPKGKKGKKKGNKGKRQKKGGEKKFDETKKVFNADDDYEKIEKTPLYLVENLASIKRDVVVDELDMVEPGKGKLLLAKTRLKLAQGRNYGLCGRNGIGKTTLLRLIASGSLKEFPAYLKVLHVRQEVPCDDRKVVQFVAECDEEYKFLKAEEERLYDILEAEDDEDPGFDPQDRLEKIEARRRDLGVDQATARATNIVIGLGFTNEMREKKTSDLSGGWRCRVALACALFVAPDLLLLDEPTNHLDFPGVTWLEEYLKNYKNTCIIVSHDKTFLNNISTDIIHIENQKLNYYKGNYKAFERTRAEMRRTAEKAYEAQRLKISHMKQFIERYRKDESKASLVQSRVKELQKMEREGLCEEVKDDKKLSFRFPEPTKLDHDIARIIDMDFGYNPDKLVLKKANFNVTMKDRVGVLGVNGCGKSTLLKLILKMLEPTEGKIEFNRYARVAYFTQHHMDHLDPKLTPVEFLQHKFKEDNVKTHEARQHLGRFALSGDLQLQPIGSLSGGQKSRVSFAALTWKHPHVLVMDEPTNHLDIETIEALIEAVKEFKGGIIMVSHDQYFLDNIAEEFWGINDEGESKAFLDLDEAKEFSYASCFEDNKSKKSSNESKRQQIKQRQKERQAQKKAEKKAREAKARQEMRMREEKIRIEKEAKALKDREAFEKEMKERGIREEEERKRKKEQERIQREKEEAERLKREKAEEEERKRKAAEEAKKKAEEEAKKAAEAKAAAAAEPETLKKLTAAAKDFRIDMDTIDVLRENEIDDDDILDLSKKDLKDLGIKMAQVVRILKAANSFSS
ncbi:hypothetical protein AAMO2058_000203500 [Amorphochlora amoebiformis]|mmetsp:Transcript_25707/g.40658  ORF Transcript_25707/g.40658 Transcript_25707/m.40658 type:complete len:798 (-) Transcript_25707:182-2575(-)